MRTSLISQLSSLQDVGTHVGTQATAQNNYYELLTNSFVLRVTML